MRKQLSILFIGNSHTYYNDMPLMVKDRAQDDGYDCRVCRIAHPGWYLDQHVKEPEVRFNILYGGYDYVILQEHAHPFGPEERFIDAVVKLDKMIRKADSRTILYSCWSRKAEPEAQAHMDQVHRLAAERVSALLAPDGENWWDYQKSYPELELYAQDGEHASEAGSDFAAKYIWETILTDVGKRNVQMK